MKKVTCECPKCGYEYAEVDEEHIKGRDDWIMERLHCRSCHQSSVNIVPMDVE